MGSTLQSSVTTLILSLVESAELGLHNTRSGAAQSCRQRGELVRRPERQLCRLHRQVAISSLSRRDCRLDVRSQPIRRRELARGFGRVPAKHRERGQLVAYARLPPAVAQLVMFGEARKLHSEGAFGFAAQPGYDTELVERPGDPLPKGQLLAQVKALTEQQPGARSGHPGSAPWYLS